VRDEHPDYVGRADMRQRFDEKISIPSLEPSIRIRGGAECILKLEGLATIPEKERRDRLIEIMTEFGLS